MKILYVEDNAVNLSLIQRIAQMNRHELISFDEAEIALDILEKGEHVDLILLDIQLAGEMDGIAFAKIIRERGYQQPIIAITAYAMMGDKERIIAAGCNEYLPKPLPIAEFLTLLAKYDPSVVKEEDKKPAVTLADEPALTEEVTQKVEIQQASVALDKEPAPTHLNVDTAQQPASEPEPLIPTPVDHKQSPPEPAGKASSQNNRADTT